MIIFMTKFRIFVVAISIIIVLITIYVYRKDGLK